MEVEPSTVVVVPPPSKKMQRLKKVVKCLGCVLVLAKVVTFIVTTCIEDDHDHDNDSESGESVDFDDN